VLDTILVTGDRTGLAQRGHQSRLGVFEGLHGPEKKAPLISTSYFLSNGGFQQQTYQNMLRFITGLGEVQVMLNGVRLVSSQLDRHIEFTPSFLLNAERRLLEDYSKWSISFQSEKRTHRAMYDQILAVAFWIAR
jgi:hypothetical protein